jgi:hypothetical protein
MEILTYKRINDAGEIEEVDTASGEIISVKKQYDLVSNYTGKFKPTTGVIMALGSLIRSGKTLKKISEMPGMPPLDVLYLWKNNSEDFKKAVEDAERDRADYFHDKLVDKVEDIQSLSKDEIPAMKLYVDTIKYLAEADNPDKYKPKPGSSEQGGGSVTIQVNTGIDRSAKVEDNVVITDYKDIDNAEVKETSTETE